MANKKVWIVVLGVVFLLILGFWYYNYGPKPLPKLPSSEEVKAETSNWQEYVNDSYGFKVKRPPNAIEAPWFGDEGVAFEIESENDYFVCSINIAFNETEMLSNDDINWKETVVINGREVERKHQMGFKRNYEYIVVEGPSYIFELEADLDDGYRKTCDLIFSTFEITN